MPQDQNHLIWLDMEMSGLDPEKDRILEVACVITDSQLEMIHEGVVWVFHQSDSILNSMDEWNKKTHGRSGLIDKVKASTLTEETATEQILAFCSEYVPQCTSPLCGNSVHQDRRFLVKYMPRLEQYLHYRNLDISTLKELCKRWRPSIYSQFKKQCKHEALADIHESIEELKFYRDRFINLGILEPTIPVGFQGLARHLRR